MSKRLLVSTFSTEHDIVAATKAALESGYKIVDAYTPYAIHGLGAAMEHKPSKLPWVCFILGLTGAVAKLWYQIWTSATSWPVNVGGKPLRSVPAFVPVTFEIMVLFAGVGTVIAFFIVSRLWPGKKPKVLYNNATDDRFVLVLEETNAQFEIATVQELFTTFNVLNIEERIEGRADTMITEQAYS